MNATLEATIQVFLQVEKERLTTSRVAHRAGVPVGTLSHYFPNKTALQRAALKRHMDEVAEAIELVCHEQKGNSLEQMASARMTAFLGAKMKDAKASEMVMKANRAVVAKLKTASGQLTTDPNLVASILQGAMGGVSRRLLESAASSGIALPGPRQAVSPVEIRVVRSSIL